MPKKSGEKVGLVSYHKSRNEGLSSVKLINIHRFYGSIARKCRTIKIVKYTIYYSKVSSRILSIVYGMTGGVGVLRLHLTVE